MCKNYNIDLCLLKLHGMEKCKNENEEKKVITLLFCTINETRAFFELTDPACEHFNRRVWV